MADARPPWQFNPRDALINRDHMVGREGHEYIADDDLIAAVNVAAACGMPLLLTGEPGCGKTDFAYAVAAHVAAADRRERGEVIFDCAIRSDSRARDLLYAYDAVHRFSDAQLRGKGMHVEDDHPANYIDLQAFGRALMARHRTVVLLDEIDKAPRDLPNDLLRALEDNDFEIPELPDPDPRPTTRDDKRHLRRRMVRPDKELRPLVIITSNQEQQLPEPFLRRCAFHHIAFPDKQGMREILRAHFRDRPPRDDGELRAFVDIPFTLRAAKLRKVPGTAEVLRWVTAMRVVFPPADRAGRLARFLAALDEKRPVPDLPWREVPALQCLVKQREDLERLKVVAIPGAGR